MKKLAPILVVVIALLMQVRVAYGCDPSGTWSLERCASHGTVVDDHPDAPSDRGDRCDVSLDLAVRAGRTGADHLVAELTPPTGGDFVALLPATLSIVGLLPDDAASPPQRVRSPAVGAGTRTWLSTARLRL
ncbi:MAG: hypothetical protein C0434_11615 [Xanthomonadaceae bacterium]|nr:hypothetical protein [Xanthomonadaceae bacterium]